MSLHTVPSSIFWMLSTLFSVSPMKVEASFIKPRDSRSPSFKLSQLSRISMPMVSEFSGLRSSWKMYLRKFLRASVILRKVSSERALRALSNSSRWMSYIVCIRQIIHCIRIYSSWWGRVVIMYHGDAGEEALGEDR